MTHFTTTRFSTATFLLLQRKHFNRSICCRVCPFVCLSVFVPEGFVFRRHTSNDDNVKYGVHHSSIHMSYDLLQMTIQKDPFYYMDLVAMDTFFNRRIILLLLSITQCTCTQLLQEHRFNSSYTHVTYKHISNVN